jgi:hypothetical protein
MFNVKWKTLLSYIMAKMSYLFKAFGKILIMPAVQYTKSWTVLANRNNSLQKKHVSSFDKLCWL